MSFLRIFLSLVKGGWCAANARMPGGLQIFDSQLESQKFIPRPRTAFGFPHHILQFAQSLEVDVITTSKLLSRALWVRRPPFRLTLSYPRARMATNSASYNPSKEWKIATAKALTDKIFEQLGKKPVRYQENLQRSRTKSKLPLQVPQNQTPPDRMSQDKTLGVRLGLRQLQLERRK